MILEEKWVVDMKEDNKTKLKIMTAEVMNDLAAI